MRLGSIEVFETEVMISPRADPRMTLGALKKLVGAAIAADAALRNGAQLPGADGRPEPEDPQGTGEDAGSIPVASITEQVPEALPVATPAAGAQSRPTASGTAEPRAKVRCPECPAMMLPMGLAIHLAKRHGIHRTKAIGHPDPISVPEPLRAHSYLCRFCSASFKDKLDLEVHEASHPPAATPKFVGAPKVGGLEAME